MLIMFIVTIMQHTENPAIVKTVYSGIFRRIQGHSAIFRQIDGCIGAYLGITEVYEVIIRNIQNST